LLYKLNYDHVIDFEITFSNKKLQNYLTLSIAKVAAKRRLHWIRYGKTSRIFRIVFLLSFHEAIDLWEVLRFIAAQRLMGKGLGYVDVHLLAAALLSRGGSVDLG
jgi:hypothetical protein